MTTESQPYPMSNITQNVPSRSKWTGTILLVILAIAVLVLTFLSLSARPASTITASQIGPYADVNVVFEAGQAAILSPGQCLYVTWLVENAQEVLLNGTPVEVEGTQEVCLNSGVPTLSVVLPQETRDFALNIVVLSQHRVMLAASAASLFLLVCAVLLAPPIARRLDTVQAAAKARVQQVDGQVSTTTLLSRTERFFRVVLTAFAIVYLLMFVGIAVARITHPYELEWMEGASVDTASRILQGQPLYTSPSVDYVSPIYGPVYFYVSAFFSLIFGVGFLPLRLVSLLATIGSFAIIYKFVKRETGDTFSGILAAGLFAATFNATGSWFDLARVDSLFLFFLLLGIYLVKFHPSPYGYAAAGIVFSLSILTKQSALVAVAPIVLYCLLCYTRLSLYLIITMIVAVVGSTLLGEYLTDGWYSYYVFGLAEQQAIVRSVLLDFWRTDLPVLSLALVMLIVVIYRQFAFQQFIQARFYTLFAVGMIVAAWLGRLHSGGWVNSLFSAYGALAIFFGIGIAILIFLTRELSSEKRSPILVALYTACVFQFLGLLYDPATHVPNQHDIQAGDAFIQHLRETEGEALLFGHGYYATLAGKSGPQLGWLMNITSQGDSPLKEAFMASVNDAVAQQRFGAIVGDNAVFLHEDFDPILNTYYDVQVIPYQGTEFIPITGMETRPTFFFTPRTDLPED